ncbi:TonB-linked outer membrane protein, SusC/RagA family [bacterium A37T11]|nr:TonB-linked outer membrane protein, SusC/RagA family [bacterium A37T11]
MRNLFTSCLVVGCLLFSANIARGQDITVSGKVTDAAGAPLPGVSVILKGTTRGTQTSESGNYTIKIPGNGTLSFSYITYSTQEIPINGQAIVNVSLKEESSALDEVVVIGYGTAQKRDLTGSITQVKGADIVNKPGTNPVANLQGKVSGLQVTNSGRPGQEPDIRIRGTNSINGAKPLYVVDGMLNDNINFLNPDDIDHIDILKDPSSLAIFGVRGANGVIAITTKRAVQGQLNFEFSTKVGMKDVNHRMDLTDATQFKELYDEQLRNQGSSPYNYDNWTGNTDWQNEIFRHGIINYNNISVSGATERNSFRMGLGNMVDQGVINHEQQSQYSLNFSDELKITDHFKTGIVFNGYRAKLPVNRDVFGAVLAAPIAPVYNDDYGLYYSMPDFQRAQVGNPLVDIEERKNTAININYRAVGNVYAEVDFFKNFTFRVNLSGDYGFNTFRNYQGLVSVYNPDLDGDNKAEAIGNLLTSVQQEQNTYYKYQTDWLLSYKNSFGKHNINATAGYTTYIQGVESTVAKRTQGDGLEIPNDPDYWYAGIGDANTQTNDGTASEYRTLSYLGRAMYNYDGKYLFNASYRLDGSSAFAKGGKPWQSFYAFGGAWDVTKENFMNDQKIFDLVKVKGSWGSLGNQNVGGDKYPMYPQLQAGNSAVFGDRLIPSYGQSYIPDPNLHWEVVKSWEAGFEMRAFKNRLNLDAVYYHKKTDGVLVTVPGIAGSVPGLGNLGQIENKGLEISTGWTQQMGKDFSVSLGGNITTVDNKVLSLSSAGYDIVDGPSRTVAGQPIGYFYGLIEEGVFQTQEEIRLAPTNGLGGGDFLPGDIRYKDINDDGVIDVKDRTIIGNPTPDFYYGVSLGLNYKNFDLGLDFQGVYGNEIFRTWNQNQYATFNFLTDRLNRWNGVGTSNWEPILNEGRSNNRQNSSYYIEDGSFFRLRDVTLGYTFPTEVIKRMRIKGLRIYLNAQNAFTWSHNTGFTPEIGGSATKFGVDAATYPVPAIYTFGLNLNF